MLGTFLALLALATAPQDDKQRLLGGMMRTIEVVSGDHGGGAAADIVVVNTEPQWDKLRGQIGIPDEDNQKLFELRGPLHGIDWNRDQLVFARAGQRPTGGYKVVVHQVLRLRNPENWRVDVTVKPPKPDTVSIQVITNPYVVFRMRKVKGKPFYFVHDAKPK